MAYPWQKSGPLARQEWRAWVEAGRARRRQGHLSVPDKGGSSLTPESAQAIEKET